VESRVNASQSETALKPSSSLAMLVLVRAGPQRDAVEY
jgi:hypothetical protein